MTPANGESTGRRRTPVVSALMRTRDRPEMFALTLASALAQTLHELEVVVVEDGGRPYAERHAEALGDARVRVIRHDEPLGPLGATRRALESARARYVAFLDDDDLWDPTLLETLAGPLDEHPDVVVAFCARRYVDAHGAELDPADPSVWFPDLPTPPRGRIQPFVREALVAPVVHVSQSALIRRNALDAADLDPAIDSAWDRLVSYLLCRDGGAAWCEPVTLASYRIHPGALSAILPPDTRDGRIELARRLVDDPRLEAWREPLGRQLAGMLLGRALLLDERRDMRSARRDVLEALSIDVTLRGLRTLPVTYMPPEAARSLQRLVRRLRRRR